MCDCRIARVLSVKHNDFKPKLRLPVVPQSLNPDGGSPCRLTALFIKPKNSLQDKRLVYILIYPSYKDNLQL